MAYPPCVTFNYPYGTARYCRANDGRRDRISEPFGLANSINLPVFSANKSFFLDNLSEPEKLDLQFQIDPGGGGERKFLLAPSV